MPARRSLFVLTLVATLALLAATGYAWTRDETNEPDAAGAVERGRKLFLSKGCAGCHHIVAKDIVIGFGAGPDLSSLPDMAGLRAEDQPAESYVRASILSPQAYIVPGYSDSGGVQMPQLAIAPDELDALVAFLLAGP